MTEQHVILVSRLWQSPEIRVDVTGEGIAIALPLNAALVAMVEQMGNPALLFTKAQLLAALQQAADQVVYGMKAETARVV